ncbi:hypothetical protein ACFZDG_35510 [Kitasatospora xanthocidica]|uniref:hypothetical protein n=1 Tax=Kitasatospora xanthocidica TaxID=83382 RepID=UPI0036E9D995
MTRAWHSDAVEKLLPGLTPGERAAVEAVRSSLELDPDPARARGLPDADPHSETYAIELLPSVTGGRGISVVYRYVQHLDSCLVLWLIVGP